METHPCATTHCPPPPASVRTVLVASASSASLQLPICVGQHMSPTLQERGLERLLCLRDGACLSLASIDQSQASFLPSIEVRAALISSAAWLGGLRWCYRP